MQPSLKVLLPAFIPPTSHPGPQSAPGGFAPTSPELGAAAPRRRAPSSRAGGTIPAPGSLGSTSRGPGPPPPPPPALGINPRPSSPPLKRPEALTHFQRLAHLLRSGEKCLKFGSRSHGPTASAGRRPRGAGRGKRDAWSPAQTETERMGSESP